MKLRETPQSGGPYSSRARRDGRLGEVIDNESHVRQSLHQRERGGQLARAHEDVVREASLTDRGDASAHVLFPEPLGIGLVVNLMADPDELLSTRSRLQRADLLRDVRGEVDPADDARDEVVFRGRRKEFARLVEARSGLHEDRAADAVRGEQRLEVLGAEPPADRREGFGHPGIGRLGRVPEMVVSIYDHAAPSGYAYSRRDCGFISML